MSTNASIARGGELTDETWADFVRRLRHHCKGAGVVDHGTADAIFIVQARRIIYGIDRDYTDRRVVISEDRDWFSPQEYWDGADKKTRADLNRKMREWVGSQFMKASESDQWEVLGELEDHTVTGWDERWEYVCSHFTKEAAEAFIRRKKHDYPKGLRIYVEAQLYCWEWNTIKAAIMDGRLALTPGVEAPARDGGEG